MKTVFISYFIIAILNVSVKSTAQSVTMLDSVNVPVSGKCVPDKNSSTLNIVLIQQETEMWCWAASAQMCMSFLGKNISQCLQANKEFNCEHCCTNVDDTCIQGGWPEFEKYSFSADRTSGTPLSWEEIKKQIDCLKKPVVFSWHWIGKGGHMMVVIGYKIVDNKNYLIINDPLPDGEGRATISYDTYIQGSDHIHWDDFYNITQK